jgi:hypothetical protein
MAIFNKTRKAAISPAPSVAAAVAGGYMPNQSGVNMIGQYYTYQEGEARNKAISVPTINRARDLMASVIGCMPLKMYLPAQNTRGRWMTNVQGDVGFPDLFMVHPFQTVGSGFCRHQPEPARTGVNWP